MAVLRSGCVELIGPRPAGTTVCALANFQKVKEIGGELQKRILVKGAVYEKKVSCFEKKVLPDAKKLPRLNKNRQVTKQNIREACLLNCCFFIEYLILH